MAEAIAVLIRRLQGRDAAERGRAVLRAANDGGVLSVECDTLDEARRSLDYLKPLCGEGRRGGGS